MAKTRTTRAADTAQRQDVGTDSAPTVSDNPQDPVTANESEGFQDVFESDDLEGARRGAAVVPPQRTHIQQDEIQKQTVDALKLQVESLKDHNAILEKREEQAWAQSKRYVNILLIASTIFFGGNLFFQLLAAFSVHDTAKDMREQITESRSQVATTKETTQSLKIQFDDNISQIKRDFELAVATLKTTSDSTRNDLTLQKAQSDAEVRRLFEDLTTKLQETEAALRLSMSEHNAAQEEMSKSTAAVQDCLALITTGYTEMLTDNVYEANSYAQRVHTILDLYCKQDSDQDCLNPPLQRMRTAAWILQAHCGMQLGKTEQLRAYTSLLVDNDCGCLEGIRYQAFLSLHAAADTYDIERRTAFLRAAAEEYAKLKHLADAKGNVDTLLRSVATFHLDEFAPAHYNANLYIDGFDSNPDKRKLLSPIVQTRLMVATAIRELVDYIRGTSDVLRLPSDCGGAAPSLPELEGDIYRNLIIAVPQKLKAQADTRAFPIDDADIAGIEYYCHQVNQRVRDATQHRTSSACGACAPAAEGTSMSTLYKRGEAVPDTGGSAAPAPVQASPAPPPPPAEPGAA